MAGALFPIVRPRVISPHTGDVLQLEDVLATHLAQGEWGVVELQGDPLSGKTTAIEFLDRRFADERNLTFLDGDAELRHHLGEPSGICVSTVPPHYGANVLGKYHLAPWGQDEWIEYLLAAHKSRCGEVIGRLSATKRFGSIGGNAFLWRMVLDELAVNDSHITADEALRVVLDQAFATCLVREPMRKFALVACDRLADDLDEATRELATHRIERFHLRLLALETVRIFLAAEALVLHLREDAAAFHLRRRLPASLIREFALDVQADNWLRQKLEFVVVDEDRRLQAMAASILHAVDKKWQPARRPSKDANPSNHPFSLPSLDGAIFEGANWPRIDLRGVVLAAAQLSDADLECAQMEGAMLDGANLSGATLRGATLDRISALQADFSRADLACVRASWAKFHGDVSAANFEGAQLVGASFEGANLIGARFLRTNLTRAWFTQADITDADFTEANLDRSWFKGLDLRVACFEGAVFSRARLQHCNLEGMQLPGANFERANLEGAYLTSSTMSQANLRGADLQGAGLADVEWEGVDLRGADLRNASFHLGSTRCGLVDSPYPSHGTRTGFYTDDYNEQDFKAPEEIRKANLCGADLRGAIINGVDFYLVDLRDAKFDDQQAAHLRQCGAILKARAV